MTKKQLEDFARCEEIGRCRECSCYYVCDCGAKSLVANTALALFDEKEKLKALNRDLAAENEQLKADLLGKENEIDVLKWRVKYLSQFKPLEKEEIAKAVE